MGVFPWVSESWVLMCVGGRASGARVGVPDGSWVKTYSEESRKEKDGLAGSKVARPGPWPSPYLAPCIKGEARCTQ